MTIDSKIFVGTVGEGVFRSDDGGESFVRKSNGMFVECDVRALAAHPHERDVVFAGTNEGLYHTTDHGENWTRIDSPMNSMVIWSLLLDPRNPQTMFAGTRPGHVFRSTDSGRTWLQLNVAIERDCKNLVFNRVTTLMADPVDSDTFWAGVEIGGIHVTRDRGESWTALNEGLSSLDVHGLEIVPRGQALARILATTNNGLNISDDGGRTWMPQRMAGRFSRPYFRGLVQAGNDRNVLLMGNGDGPPGSVGTIWRSTDQGRNWSEAKMPCIANSTIWGFATHRSIDSRVLAHSVSGELFESEDCGASWAKIGREFGEIRSLLWL